MEHSRETIAMLIDADNSPSDKIDFILAEMAKYGVVNIRRAYGNWKSRSLKGWEDKLHDYAIRPIQQFDYTKGKNATDMAMTIDAMDLLYSKKLDAFCIVSSDSDFTPLVMRILSEGLNVYGFGQKSTPSPFVNACSTFLYVDSLGVQEKAKSDGGRRKSGYELKGDSKLMTLIKIAVDSAQEEDGWSNLAKIGKNISNQASFDPRNYGYKRLSDLIRSIDLFEIEFRNNNSELYIRDRRKARPLQGGAPEGAPLPPSTEPVSAQAPRPAQQERFTPRYGAPESVAPSSQAPRAEQPRAAAPVAPAPPRPVAPEAVAPSLPVPKAEQPKPVEPVAPVAPEPATPKAEVPEPALPKPAEPESGVVVSAAPEAKATPAVEPDRGKEQPASSEERPVKPAASRSSRSRARSKAAKASAAKPAAPETEVPVLMVAEVAGATDEPIEEVVPPTTEASPSTQPAESRPKRRTRRSPRKKTEPESGE